MPLLQYRYRDSLLHKLHPLVKLAFFITLGTLESIYWDLRFLFPLLLFTLILIKTSKIPRTLFKYTLAFWVAMWINPLNFIFSSFMAPSAFFKVLPKDFVSRVVFQITPAGFPVFGYTAVTYGTLYYYFASRFKGLVTLSIASLSIHTINLSDMVQVLIWMRMMNIIVLAFMMQYRFAIVFQRKIELLLRSLRLRGWRISRSRDLRILLKDFVRARRPFALGLGLGFVDVISGLHKVVMIRGFRIGKIYPSRLHHFSLTDYFVSAVSILSILVALYLMIFYNIGMI